MRMRSPSAPFCTRIFCRSAALALRPAIAGSVPIWTKGPAVWDGVSFSAISRCLVLEIGAFVSTQHDVEAVGQAIEGPHGGHIELSNQAGDRGRILDRVDDRAMRDEWIALEIELGHQALHEGMPEDRKMDM